MNSVSISPQDYAAYQRDADLADLVMGLAGVDKERVSHITLRDSVWRFTITEIADHKLLERTVVWAI